MIFLIIIFVNKLKKIFSVLKNFLKFFLVFVELFLAFVQKIMPK